MVEQVTEQKTTIETEYWLSVPAWLILATGLAIVLHCLTWQWGPIAVARDIDRLEQRVKAMEAKLAASEKE